MYILKSEKYKPDKLERSTTSLKTNDDKYNIPDLKEISSKEQSR